MEDREKFFAEVEERWRQAIAAVGAAGEQSLTWTGAGPIAKALRPFLGSQLNHALYPTGGGFDWPAEGKTCETGCLAVLVGEEFIDVFRPARMILEHFPEQVRESFMLIELAPLQADPADPTAVQSQELVEIPGRGYRSREVWDRGYLGHDDDGREIPLPAGSRLVARWLGGKILLVAKGSIWNSIPGTYDARHNTLSSEQIRAFIEGAMRSA